MARISKNKNGKIPRSSRKCFRCEHNYSSHIDVGCLKIVQLKPDKKECICREFVKNEVELEMSDRRIKAVDARRKREREEKKEKERLEALSTL